MKKRFSVDIHAAGSLNKELFAAITSHNSGKQTFTLSDLIGFLTVVKAVYPSLHSDLNWQTVDDDTLVVLEGETPCLTIVEKTVVGELTEDDKQDFHHQY